MATTRKDTTPNRKPTAPAQPTVASVTKTEPAPLIKPAPAAPAFVSMAKPAPAVAPMPFGPANYRLMLAGIALIVVGFVIMGQDKETFGFGFPGLTLGPVVVMAGFVLEFFAIMARPKA
jgi:hypothetical protein